MLQGVYVLTVNYSLIIKEIKLQDLSLNFYGFEFNCDFVKKLLIKWESEIVAITRDIYFLKQRFIV